MSTNIDRGSLTGGDANRFYEQSWVEPGFIPKDHKLPSGKAGFNLSALMRHHGERRVGYMPDPDAEQPKRADPAKHDTYGVVKVDDWLDGWKNFLSKEFGTPSPFLTSMAVNEETDLGQYDVDNPKSPLEKLVTTIEQKTAVTSSTVQAASPIIVDPLIFETVRSNAPILNVVPVVPQAGFTAEYNAFTGREGLSPGAVNESGSTDLSSESGQGFTISNETRDMKIVADVVDISDFAQRAESTLGYMDLEGTTLEQRAKEFAIFKGQGLYYGDPDQSEGNGSIEDSAYFDGLREIADEASGDYTISKSGVDLSGDKALFTDIKKEIHALTSTQAVNRQDLQIMCSWDVYDAMENEAQLSVRIDSFDGDVNFGGRTLSISGVPVMPDANIGTDTDLTGDADDGDVFIFDRTAVQFRALAPYSALPLGRVGLSDRAALFEYGTLIDKSQGEHTRVLQGYDVDSLSA